MGIGTAITPGIGIAGFVGGVIWKIVDLSVSFGRLTQRIAGNEERDREERVKSSARIEAKFDRLIEQIGSGVPFTAGKENVFVFDRTGLSRSKAACKTTAARRCQCPAPVRFAVTPFRTAAALQDCAA